MEYFTLSSPDNKTVKAIIFKCIYEVCEVAEFRELSLYMSSNYWNEIHYYFNNGV